MSDSDNLILKMLAEMRAEVRETNERIDQTNVLIDRSSAQTNGRIDHAVATLRGDVADVRAELTAVELRGATRDTELIASSRNLSKMLEADVAELKKKIG